MPQKYLYFYAKTIPFSLDFLVLDKLQAYQSFLTEYFLGPLYSSKVFHFHSFSALLDWIFIFWLICYCYKFPGYVVVVVVCYCYKWSDLPAILPPSSNFLATKSAFCLPIMKVSSKANIPSCIFFALGNGGFCIYGNTRIYANSLLWGIWRNHWFCQKSESDLIQSLTLKQTLA